MKDEKIFIQIASYRDPELLPTIKDCISKSKKPNNLVFSICWQHSKEDKWDDLSEYMDDPRFKIIDIDYKDSKGACWARNTLQQQYNNEKYTLQLDSHHRFLKNWDEECINMVKELQKKGHKKPMLTGYIPSYDPKNDPDGRVNIPWKTNFDRFLPEGAIFFIPSTIDNYFELDGPIPARFYSAHFCFTLGQFVKEVPHDPDYYFHGEEISIGVRAFTWGYDLFHTHKVVMWHEYIRDHKKKHWDDDTKWSEKNNFSHKKNRKLFGMDGEINDIDFGVYGFGNVRTLEDFERYAGVNFKTRGVQKYTTDNNIAPNPVIEDEEEYKNSFFTIFKHCIDLYDQYFPEPDYDFWVVSFEEMDGTVIFRQDADKEEVTRLKNSSKHDNGWIRLWRQYNGKKPDKWVVWPHSVSKGWCERVEQIL